MAPEAAALMALAAIWHWQREVQETRFGRVLVLAWGTTAFGSVHMVADYVFMLIFSEADWDVPPLTGSFTVVTLLVSAVLPLVLALRSSPHGDVKDKMPHAARSPSALPVLRPSGDRQDR